MRICISGTSSQGKSTFVKDFIKEWPSYTTPTYSYRELIGESHSKKTNKDMQLKILDSMVDEVIKHGEDDKIVYDRGPLDNLAYSLWANSKGIVDDETISKSLPLLRESLKFIDIIFYIPITEAAKVDYDTEEFQKYKAAGFTDEQFREEVDNIFKVLKYDWDSPESKFCETRDKPPIIEVFGQPHERIHMVKWYLDADGDLIDNVGVFTENDIQEMEQLKASFGVQDKTSEAYRNPTGT